MPRSIPPLIVSKPGAAIALLAVLVVLAPVPRSRAESDAHLVIKMATTAADGSPLVRQMQRLAAIIEQRCAGLTHVKLFPDGRLGDDATLLQAVSTGALQIYAGEFNAFAKVVPEAAVLSTPFLFDSYEDADRALDGAGRARFEAALGAHGMALGAWGPSVFTRWFTRGEAPVGLDAFAGLAVADPEDDSADAWAFMQANPLASLDARRQHERWLLRATTVRARATGEDEEASHVTRSDDVLRGHAIVISQRWFDGLPARMQEALGRWPKDPTEQGRSEARELDRALLERMQGRGKVIADLSASARKAFAPVGRKLSAERARATGARAQSLLNALRQ